MKNYNYKTYRIPKQVKLKADASYAEYCARPENPEQDAEFQRMWDESHKKHNMDKYLIWKKKWNENNPNNLI